jgi:O-antigen/teichoic acid export membrane protein
LRGDPSSTPLSSRPSKVQICLGLQCGDSMNPRDTEGVGRTVTPSLDRRVRPLLRMGWGVADQALSSFTNFALVILVARAVGPAELGAFALFLAGYTALTVISAGITAEPLMLRYSGVGLGAWADGARAALGCTLILGIACSVVLGVVEVFFAGTTRELLVIGAICGPGLLIQDAMRYAFFASGRPRKAFVNDALWTVFQVCGIIGATSLAHGSVVPLVAAWAAAGAFAGAFALIQGGIIPHPGSARRWLREQRDLWAFLLPEFLTVQGANYLSLITIGAVAGVSAVAAVRAAQALYGPLNVAFSGIRVIALPHLVALQGDQVRSGVRVLVMTTASFAALWGTLTIVMPPRFGTALLGQTWALATPLFGLMAIDRIGAFAAESWRTGLLSLGSVKRSLSVRLLVAVISIAGVAVGSATSGARGAVLASAIISPLAALMFWRQFVLAGQLSSVGRAATPKN